MVFTSNKRASLLYLSLITCMAFGHRGLADGTVPADIGANCKKTIAQLAEDHEKGKAEAAQKKAEERAQRLATALISADTADQQRDLFTSMTAELSIKDKPLDEGLLNSTIGQLKTASTDGKEKAKILTGLRDKMHTTVTQIQGGSVINRWANWAKGISNSLGENHGKIETALNAIEKDVEVQRNDIIDKRERLKKATGNWDDLALELEAASASIKLTHDELKKIADTLPKDSPAQKRILRYVDNLDERYTVYEKELTDTKAVIRNSELVQNQVLQAMDRLAHQTQSDLRTLKMNLAVGVVASSGEEALETVKAIHESSGKAQLALANSLNRIIDRQIELDKDVDGKALAAQTKGVFDNAMAKSAAHEEEKRSQREADRATWQAERAQYEKEILDIRADAQTIQTVDPKVMAKSDSKVVEKDKPAVVVTPAQ